MRWDHEHARPLPDAPAAAQALQGTQAGPARSPSRLVPTLTDVLEVNAARPAGTAGLAPAAAPAGLAGLADAPAVGTVLRAGAPERPAAAGEELVQRVLAELQPQLDQWLQQRLGEVMGTAMARLGEALRDELRVELAPALHAMVAQAVAHELARHEGP